MIMSHERKFVSFTKQNDVSLSPPTQFDIIMPYNINNM